LTVSLCFKPKPKQSTDKTLECNQALIKSDKNSFSKFKVVGYVANTDKNDKK